MRRTLLLALAVALLATPILAETVQTFIGDTTNGSSWNRPVQGDPPTSVATSDPGVNVAYSVQAFKLLADSSCYIVSAQAFDGYIFLYAGGFNPASPLANVVSGDDDGILGVGTSYIPNSGPTGTSTLSLSAGTYYLVTTGYRSTQFGAFQNTVHCQGNSTTIDAPLIVQGACGYYNGIPVEDAVCFGSRFLTAIYNVSNSSNGGFGVPVRVGSTDTALFWFYSDTNWEFMVKVLNGCAVNGRYWVFGGGLTNQAYNLVVTDVLASGQPQVHYVNTLGTRAAAIADTNAFNTCF